MKAKADQTIKSGIEEINNKIEDRTTFFYYAFRNILLIGLPLLVISGFILSLSHSSATDGSSGTDNLTISIYSACTLSSVVNNEHNTIVDVGTYKDNIGKTTIKTLCNDGNGYAIYANGYSNNEEGNNKLINSEYPQYSIDTGLATSGLTSTWAMKLNNIENDPSPTPPVIESDYNDTYGLVPTIWTKVAGRTAGTTDMDEGSSFTTTYSVYASSNQHAGTYLGQVKYALLHPSTEPYYPFMQDVANWSSTKLPNVGDSIQAMDERDGKIYWVTKLADGHIWMTQNLDLSIGGTGVAALTSENTDISTTASGSGIYSTSYGYSENNGVWTWTPTRNTINFEGDTFSGWQNDTSTPYSVNKTDDTSTGHTSLGNWYNWTAAIASNNSSSLTRSTLNNINNNPQNSICPKGWRLPTISNQSEAITGSTNEFARLNYLYNNGQTSGENVDTNLLAEPLWFVRSGYAYTNYIENYATDGIYWSSTVYNESMAYNFNFSNSDINTTSYNKYSSFTRRLGSSIRCVAK